ncbi:DUF7553 family protein [Halocalculus aciditolerans]|uniref:Uncharacterized protein n=1 Tax=Halocalculus aciditolerans TaxID=1383812 RepID=A0A830F173_9EURY|nr:hypothetical protein [Halocalculus aciditolerans]GGL52551.1 hypothetical protein GCM10009039_08490 [Halocalculus aciditolerans]
MNQHFKDAQHHLTKAAEDARHGIEDELDDVETRVRELIGKEKDPEPSRVEKLQADLKNLEQRAEGEAKNAIGDARLKIDAYRNSE